MSNPNSRPIEFYEQAVKKTLIVFYANVYLNQLDPDNFVLSLYRMFRLKKKMIRNVAAYVKRDVEEKNHPIQKVLDNIGFFAVVFMDYLDKDNGQPIHKYYDANKT